MFLGKDYNQTRNFSENTAALIDQEMDDIIRNAYSRTEKILTEHMDKLELIAKVLMKKEKIDGKDFKNLMDGTVSADEFLSEEIVEETVKEEVSDAGEN